MASNVGTKGQYSSRKTIRNGPDIETVADFHMDITPLHSSEMPSTVMPSGDEGPVNTFDLPTDVWREVVSHISIFDAANVVQMSERLSVSLRLEAISNVFALLHNAREVKQVDAAIDAIPAMLPSDRLLLLGTMIRRIIAIDPFNEGLTSHKLDTAVRGAWMSLPKDDNVDHYNEVRQSYLLSRSLLLPVYHVSCRNHKLLALLDDVNAMPVQYRPKVLAALCVDSWYLHIENVTNGLTNYEVRHPFLFDTWLQPLLDQKEALINPLPTVIQSAMAVVMLLGPPCTNVKETLCERFDISTDQERDRFEAGVVAEIVSRMPYHLIHLEPLLARWSEENMPVRRLLHDALAFQFFRPARGDTEAGYWWHAMYDPVVKLDGAMEWILGMPENAIPGFSELDATAMRFWALVWAKQWTFPSITDHLQAILKMPWQMQPTLFNALVCRHDIGQLGQSDIDIDVWSRNIAEQCIAQGYFTAALRALMVPYEVTSYDLREMRSSLLLLVYKEALARIPPSSCWPLIEEMVLACKSNRFPDTWLCRNDIVGLLKSLVGDLTYVHVPSMSYSVTSGGFFEELWDIVPDQGTATTSRFDVFCTRMNITPTRRLNVLNNIWINMDKKIQLGEIAEEEAVMQLGSRKGAA